MLLCMDGLCVPVLNTACIRNINSSQIIMIICPHIPKWMYNKRIGHHSTSKNCVFILYWPGKHGKLPVHVIDVVTDWSYAFLSDFLFPRFFVVLLANPSNFSHCKCFSSRIKFMIAAFTPGIPFCSIHLLCHGITCNALTLSTLNRYRIKINPRYT